VTKTIRLILYVVIALVVALGGWGYLEHKAYVAAKAKAGVLTAEFNDYQKQAEAIKANLEAEAVKLLAAKSAAIDAALASEQTKAQAIAERDAALAKIKALPDNDLSGAINLRIGVGLSWPVADGTFSITRYGAESVLSRFIAGEANASLYAAERSVTTNLRQALVASESESGNLGQRLYLTRGELSRAVKAWAADTSALKHLERSIIGRTVTTAVVSVGVGFAVAWGLHVAGVLK
jgi:hypothetical protein